MTYVEKNWKWIYVYITEYICIYNWIYYIGWDFSYASDSKESACNVGHLGSIPELGRSPGEGNGYPLQYSGLENSTYRGAWQATVHGIPKSRTWLRNFHFYFHMAASIAEMINHTRQSAVEAVKKCIPPHALLVGMKNVATLENNREASFKHILIMWPKIPIS